MIIKAVFSEENYVPQATMIQFEIHQYFKGDHAQTQFWSIFEVTKCCGDLE